METRRKNRRWSWLVLGVWLVLLGFRDWLAPGFLSLYNPQFHRLTPWTLIVVEWLLGAAFVIWTIRESMRRRA